MTKAELKEPARLKRLMPGLRRLALFPRKSIGIVSVETGVELADLLAWFKLFGRPEPKDIDKLEEVEAETPATQPAAGHRIELKVEAKPRTEASPLEIKCRQICADLLDNRELTESAACKEYGVLSGSWSYFKKKHFGLGPIPPEQLARYLGVVFTPAPAPVMATAVSVSIKPADVHTAPDEKRGRLVISIAGKKRLDLEFIITGEFSA